MKKKCVTALKWGILVLLLVATLPWHLQAQSSLTTLYSFSSSGTDGANPGPLVMDTAGNLYGTTAAGGTYGKGSVFKLDPSGNESVLYSFGGTATDGANPGDLVMDSVGNFYGVTAHGGGSSNCGSGGCGTIFFLLNDSGTYTENILYAFSGTDGANPSGTIAFQPPVPGMFGGQIWVPTSTGGTDGYPYGNGTLFTLNFFLANTSGATPTVNQKSVLWNFSGYPSDGSQPGGLVLVSIKEGVTAPEQILFGTTLRGGTLNQGTLFAFSAILGPNGANAYCLNKNTNPQSDCAPVNLLHSFSGQSPDGSLPSAVYSDSAGNVYGTTGSAVFTIDLSGNFSVLVDGLGIPIWLVADSNGNLYGTTYRGGSQTDGSVFDLIKSSGGYQYHLLYSFSGANDGCMPTALVFDNAGKLYGAASSCGAYGNGTVYRLGATATTTTLTSSENPADAGDNITFTATVTSGTTTPTGSVTFSEGTTPLVTQTLSSGTATLMVSAADVGIGSYTITAQYTPADPKTFVASSATITQTVNEAGVAVTGGSNSFSGNQTVNGTMTATSFVGNGSMLTGITAATASGLSCAGCVGNSQLGINYALGDSQGGNAVNADMLGGLLPSAYQPAGSYATTGANSFSGNQNVSGTLISSVVNSGEVDAYGQLMTIGTSAHLYVGPLQTPTATSSFSYSAPFDIVGSSFNFQSNQEQRQFFRWQVTPGPANTTPAATLNLSFGTDWTTPNFTGLSVNSNGTINFAPGQTFPGTGAITGLTAGKGLAGGGSSGNVTLTNTGLLSLTAGPGLISTTGQTPTLNLDTTFTDARYLQLGGGTLTGALSAPSFAGNGSALTNLNPASLVSGTAAINISGNATTATTAATATMAGNAADLGGVAAADYARLDIGNSFTGDQSVAGNVNIAGNSVTAGAVTIGSSGTPIKEHLSVLVNPSFPALLPFMCATANFTVAGLSDGNTIALGVPNERMNLGGHIVYTAWVSSTNTGTIQACNIDSLNKQKAPGTGSIRIDVWMY